MTNIRNRGEKGVESKTTKPKKSRFKNFVTATLIAATLWGAGTGYNIFEQKKVNRMHQSMDFVFNPEDLSTEELLKYLVVTPEYSGKLNRWLSQKGLTPNQINGSNSIFVSLKDHKTLDDKRQAIESLRKEASKPILVSADFEGGYVHTFDEITDDDIQKYGIPQGIIDLRNEEASKNSRVSAFPSAEYLGKKYKQIVLHGTNEERLNFLMMMQAYGNSIRLIMEDIGVDIVYGPCADIVPDFDGNSAIAKDDRSFGDSFVLGQDLISSFVWGFQSNNSYILLVPKHYVRVGSSKTDPHKDIGEVDKDNDGGTELVFQNLINGENYSLNEDKNKVAIESYEKSRKKDNDYITILQKNKEFIQFLNKNGISLKDGETIGALMTTHASGLRGIPKTITYSEEILSTMKSKVGNTKEKKMSNGLIFSDDLAMEGANQGLPKGVDGTDVNKIILALSSGHDVVLDLDSHSEGEWNKILSEAANQIESGCDINGDGKTDIIRDMLYKKVKKVLEILVKKGELQKTKDGKYRLKDATYFDPNISKVLKDSYYSNQGLISGSGIDAYKAEGDGKRDIIIKKFENMYEKNIHNFPNALRKLINKDKDYKEALDSGKKIVVVDKSECKMFIFTIDGKELLEEHAIGVGKGTNKLDYTHDRKILKDNKTPVGYYMIVDRRMGGDELREKFNNDEISRYGGENGGMLIMIGPRCPYVGIHGTEGDLGPSSNACVRVLDPSEVGKDKDKSEQKAINHLNEILPDGTFVIITN